MSEPLEIRSETRLSFEIDHGDETWLLRADGGDWTLTDHTLDRWHNLGSVKRISWLGALTRALKAIGAYDNERDGV